MALPSPPSRWVRELEQPFKLFEEMASADDDYQLYEEDNEVVLTIDMPGFDPADISVTWDDGVLNVAAEHTDEARSREKTYHRRFRFPKDIDEDAIGATYNNDVLEITLPLVEGAGIRGTEIPVES